MLWIVLQESFHVTAVVRKAILVRVVQKAGEERAMQRHATDVEKKDTLLEAAEEMISLLGGCLMQQTLPMNGPKMTPVFLVLNQFLMILVNCPDGQIWKLREERL
jgi:hypothetical protein